MYNSMIFDTNEFAIKMALVYHFPQEHHVYPFLFKMYKFAAGKTTTTTTTTTTTKGKNNSYLPYGCMHLKSTTIMYVCTVHS